MENWYKKAQRSRMVEPDTGQIIEGPDMSAITPTRMEEIKYQLETKYPTTNWTLEKVMEWINDNFIGKPKPFTGPKNKIHNF